MLTPDHRFEDVTEIDQDFLEDGGYELVLFDYDQTLTPYGADRLDPEVEEYLTAIRETVDVAILSNRVRKDEDLADELAEEYDLDTIQYSPRKPFPDGYRDALEEYGVSADETLMVGDLLTADIAGAELAGIDAALVDPVAPEQDPLYVRVSRTIDGALDSIIQEFY